MAKLFCFPFNLVINSSSSILHLLLAEFSFVILECPVLLVLFEPIPVTFVFPFFHKYFEMCFFNLHSHTYQYILTLDRAVNKRFLGTGRTYVNKRKQSRAWKEMCEHFEIIFIIYPRVRYGVLCQSQFAVRRNSVCQGERQRGAYRPAGGAANSRPPVEHLPTEKQKF